MWKMIFFKGNVVNEEHNSPFNGEIGDGGLAKFKPHPSKQKSIKVQAVNLWGNGFKI